MDIICERLSRDDAKDLFLRDDSPRIAILESEVKELVERRSGFRKKAALGKITEDALEEIEAEIAPGPGTSGCGGATRPSRRGGRSSRP
jgi:hypothetical protein